MIYQFSVPAASATVNDDLLHNANIPMRFLQSQPKNRVIDFIGLSGSTAAGDTFLEVRVGGKTFGLIYNESTGTHNKDALFPVGTVIPGGVDFELIVVDAALTNPLFVTLIMHYE